MMKRTGSLIIVAITVSALAFAGCGQKSGEETGKSGQAKTGQVDRKGPDGVETGRKSLAEKQAAEATENLIPAEKAQLSPDWTMVDIDNKSHRLSDYRGKVVILNFWDTWCPPCRKEIPSFVELQEKYSGRGFTFLGAAFGREGLEKVKQYAKEVGINYPVLLADKESAGKYGQIQSIPTTFIIDREGKIRSMQIGYAPKEVWEAYITDLL